MIGSIIFAVLCMIITVVFCWLRSSKATFLLTNTQNFSIALFHLLRHHRIVNARL